MSSSGEACMSDGTRKMASLLVTFGGYLTNWMRETWSNPLIMSKSWLSAWVTIAKNTPACSSDWLKMDNFKMLIWGLISRNFVSNWRAQWLRSRSLCTKLKMFYWQMPKIEVWPRLRLTRWNCRPTMKSLDGSQNSVSLLKLQ